MALIQVTPEVLNSKATEVRNLRSQHDDMMMARLRSLILALNETWKGEAIALRSSQNLRVCRAASQASLKCWRATQR